MRALARALDAVLDGAMWLVLPLSALLFAQWPLRELVQAYSREANDTAQILFALYVAVAVTAATRARSHLAVDALARRYSPRRRRLLARAAAAAVLAPWAVFIIATCAGPVWQSLLQLERFADTLDPGYFLVRAAALVMASLVLAQAILDAVSPQGD
jgi:TRAP-type C4-dicarboxylate transport system permease small subunit